MKRLMTQIIGHFKKIDYYILLSALAISILSSLILMGAKDTFGSRFPLIQTLTTIVGIVIALIISTIDLEYLINRLWPLFFGISILGLIVVLIFGTDLESGQANWISIPGIPINIQPSEFVKITFIISFAKHISIVKDHINKITTFLLLMLHSGAIIGILLLTGDLGSTVIYVIIMLAMLFAAGLSLWYFLGMAIIFILLLPYIWPHLAEYQQMRILCGFNPELDPNGKGYNAIKSREAIAAGGFFGAGLKGGTKYMKVPVAYADFLFAVLAEKLGFVGALFYIILISILIIRLIIIAKNTTTVQNSLIFVGVATILISQTIENIGMCLGMLPVVGITLPFFSYGGSSLLALYISIGVIESIIVHSREQKEIKRIHI